MVVGGGAVERSNGAGGFDDTMLVEWGIGVVSTRTAGVDHMLSVSNETFVAMTAGVRVSTVS